MDLEIILFSQLSQIEKDKYCILSLDIWNLKLVQMDENNDIEKDSHIENKLALTTGERKWEGARQSKDLEVRITMYKINKLQGHTLQHREYSQ